MAQIQLDFLFVGLYLALITESGGKSKVMHPKCSKHWLYTVVHSIDCVCSKMLNHGLFLSLLKLIFCPIH